MRTLLVANRGEIAVRVIRAARALGLRTVAVYSDADAQGMPAALADRAVRIGPAKPSESYLRVDAILEAARTAEADAVHPGYGFLAENAGFAHAVEAAGLVFVGPAPHQIAAMGDKARARALAAAAGVPVLPGSRGFPAGDLDGLEDAAAQVGYPLLVKASGGGGGIGMRRVDSADTLRATAQATQSMAERSFGDGAIYLERFVARARHVEVQVFGLGDGRAVHLFERECSIQRRFQKVIEESPSPGVSDDLRARMCAAAASLARSVSYRSAGTIEFVLDDDTGAFYFLEMNTRIQVEHPVTEAVTGLDLVGLQLRLARGDDLSGLIADPAASSGHAIECRICAEDPARMFLPCPGTLQVLELPSGAGIRVDSGVRAGDAITPHYDSMIAKLIAHAPTRAAAVERMAQALAATRITGIATNLAFLANIVAHPAFKAGRTLTSFIETHKAELMPAQSKGAA